jgi:hypothetical protein
MNIQTVKTNLEKTIAGKEAYLAQMKQDIVKYNQTVNHAVAKYLELNLDELRRILEDVEQCIKETV